MQTSYLDAPLAHYLCLQYRKIHLYYSFPQEIHTRAGVHVSKPAEQATAAAVKKEDPSAATAEAPPVNGATTKAEAS